MLHFFNVPLHRGNYQSENKDRKAGIFYVAERTITLDKQTAAGITIIFFLIM